MRFFLCLTATLAPMLLGCASRNLPPPTAQTSSLTGALETGTIAAIRHVGPSADPATTATILKALGQPSSAVPTSAAEIVIKKRDGTAVAMVEPGPIGLHVGQPVTIVEAATTSLHTP